MKKSGGDVTKAISLYFEEHPQDACDGCADPLIGTRFTFIFIIIIIIYY
jgi:hypothetical protein